MSGRSPDQLAREVLDVLDVCRIDATTKALTVLALAELEAQAEAGQRALRGIYEVAAAIGHEDGVENTPSMQFIASSAEAALAAAAPSPADQEEACDGSRDCRAAVHIHGCFAERPSA